MKRKKKLTAEFWRKDAEQRANAERLIAAMRRELDAKKQSAG